jgi:hypothetical protein
VRVQACDLRGRVKPEASRYVGTGHVSRVADDVTAAERALAAKYGWQFTATKLLDAVKVRIGWGERQEPVAVQLSLREDGP